MSRIYIWPWKEINEFNFKSIPDKCAYIFDKPNYFIKDISNIYVQVEPSIIINQDKYIVENQNKYFKIFTFSEYVLNNCKNAHKYYFGTTSLNDNFYNNIDISKKNFKISNIAGSKNINNAPGHIIRQIIHYSQNKLTNFPITYYRSSRQIPHIKDMGNNPLIYDNKNIVFEEYQYSIVIENSRQKNYFTEKLLDCLLSKTIPIYYGDPTIDNIFDITGWVILETGSIDELKNKLSLLNNNYYEKHINIIENNWKEAIKYINFYQNLDNYLTN